MLDFCQILKVVYDPQTDKNCYSRVIPFDIVTNIKYEYATTEIFYFPP